MKKILIIGLLVVIPTNILAFEFAKDWDRYDTALLGGFMIAHYIDYSQTLQIKNHPGLYETNKLLGKHPSDGKITRGLLISSVAIGGVSAILPPKYRKIFLGTLTVCKISVIKHNKSMGLSITLHR